jgi:hypothetical protein
VIRPGLCSVTLRHLAVDEVVGVAAAAGLSVVEWGADVHVPPGDLDAADRARAATERAGLRVGSYGSYFRADAAGLDGFRDVVASARRLGAPRIRIWAGTTASRAASPEERAAVVRATQRAADQAAEAGVEVAFEYHAGTLTDDAESTLLLLHDVGRLSVRTYWQPPLGMPDADAVSDLARVLPWVAAVHVFSWWPWKERLTLAARAPLWRGVFDALNRVDRELDALLEFVPNNDAAAVAPEAQALLELAGLPGRVS